MFFKQSTHQYIINGKAYKSWSSIIKLVEPEKDWDKIAEKCSLDKKSKYYKKTVAEIRAEWAEKGRISRERGTLFHSLKENEDISSTDKPVYYTLTEDDVKPIRSLETLEDGIYPELTLYNNEFQACGTADKVIIETIAGIRYVDVIDYKTSENIETESYFNPKEKRFDCLKSPLQHVMDCNFMKYSLQLSMYAFFLEKYNFVPRKLILSHLVIKEYDDPKTPPKYQIDHEGKTYYVEHEIQYDVKYMKKEVKALLQYHKMKSRF